MTRTLYEACGGTLCLDFVNSVGRPARGLGAERLGTYADLLRWCAEGGVLGRADLRRLRQESAARPREAQQALDRARSLRELLHRVFLAVARRERPRKSDLEELNRALAGALGHLRVVAAARGFAWEVRCIAGDLEAPLWPILRSAGELLTAPDLSRVKECASENCLWVFLDGTRNHARRWCEMQSCGNRAKVRSYRRRRNEGAGTVG